MLPENQVPSPWLPGSGTGKRWLLPLHFLPTAPPSAHYPSLQSEGHPGLLFLPLSLVFNPLPLLENFPSWVFLKCRLFILSCNCSPRLVVDYPSPEMLMAAFHFPSLIPTSAEPLTRHSPTPDHFFTQPPEKVNLTLLSSSFSCTFKAGRLRLLVRIKAKALRIFHSFLF